MFTLCAYGQWLANGGIKSSRVKHKLIQKPLTPILKLNFGKLVLGCSVS